MLAVSFTLVHVDSYIYLYYFVLWLSVVNKLLFLHFDLLACLADDINFIHSLIELFDVNYVNKLYLQ